jgi:H+/gluconate symporter-like permease
MFRNKWRKFVFYLWVVTIPLSIVGGILRQLNLFYPYATPIMLVGIFGALAGLVILKTLGRDR